MLNIFFRKVRFFFIVLFFVFSSLSFVTYLNYTHKLSLIDNDNSILNFFKPKYRSYIVINESFLNDFHNLTQQINSLYIETPGLSESVNKNPDFVSFIYPYQHNTFIFNDNYYIYKIPGSTDKFNLCKVHVEIIKNFFEENKKIFCHQQEEIDTYSIIITSNKKQINVEDINNFFINEYKNIFKKAFARAKQFNPSLKKDAQMRHQFEADASITSSFAKSASEIKLLKSNILKINIEKNNLININNKKYQIIKFDDLLKDYNSFCMSQLPMCLKIIQFYQQHDYNKILNNDLELNKLVQYIVDVDLLLNQNLEKKIILETTQFKINLVNERIKIIDDLLNSDFSNFSRNAIQLKKVDIHNNHLFFIFIILFSFSLMITFVIFFILFFNKQYAQKVN